MGLDLNKAHAQVLKKAVSDAKFRAALLKDAHGTLEKELGVKVPPGITIKVVEDSASVVHLALPPGGGALSENELKGVAGGASCANNTNIGDVPTGGKGAGCYNSTRPF